MSTPELTGIASVIGQSFGFVAIAAIGSALAASNWLRLVLWQRFSSILWQTTLTHALVLAPVAWISGLAFIDLALWDAAIFAACYISYCAYLAYARTAHLASLDPARFAQMNKLEMAAELVLCFLDRAVYRTVYSWADIAPLVTRSRVPRR